jgi:hypothetical protein
MEGADDEESNISLSAWDPSLVKLPFLALLA